jgi:cytochrome P460
MKPIAISTTLVLVLALCLAAIAAEADNVDVAEFDDSGNLVVPADLDTWVFLGSSLGMGYSQDSFDPGSPGMFQIVRMEPNAYAAFLDTGEFIDGTMIALHFYGSQNDVSINRAGFVMDNLHFAEIHYKDSKYPEGFNFFTFNPGDETAAEVALPNECVECHKRDGAYDGVFVQFYPDIQKHLPDDIQERLIQEH